MKTISIALCILLLLCLVACTNSVPQHPPVTAMPVSTAVLRATVVGEPGSPSGIARYPSPATWNNGVIPFPPVFDPDRGDYWQVDLRSADVSGVDLRQSLDALRMGDFDTQTKWPAAKKMPAGFNYQKILEIGKNPGLGIRKLHEQGITGKGISIAIIDQTLLVDHPEYIERLRLYEEADYRPVLSKEATMHASAVASIAVGKTIGVAPEADLYYIANDTFFDYEKNEYDFSYLAKSVRRVLEINRQLPESKKIRVLSIEIGWGPEHKGYDEMTQAAKEAKDAGLLVISSSVELTHGYKFHGLGRDPLADPDRFESYEPGLFWSKDFYAGHRFTDRLLVPMDSRTTAGPHGPQDYAFYRMGGWSWSIPYIAGVYALAVQVKPSITPAEFWSLAIKTGRTSQLSHNGETIPFGPMIDPVALMDVLRK